MPRCNPNLAKINRSYTYEEAAKIFGVHKNTIAAWEKQGLVVLREKKPYLVLGAHLREFLSARKEKSRRTCKLHEAYCVRCRAPREPSDRYVEYLPISESKGRLVGLCPTCATLINKFVSVDWLSRNPDVFDVALPAGMEHITGRVNSFQNCDFKQEEK